MVPIGVMYQPLLDREDLAILSQDPIVCRNEACRAILNPYCMIDARGHSWICRFCGSRNALPPSYNVSSQETLPRELLPTNTTVEYALNRKANAPLVFLFVVDVCQDDENMQALRDTLLVSLSLLPQDALVGLISYGKHVHIHELGYADTTKTLAFNGKKTYSAKQIQEVLGFLSPDLRAKKNQGPNTRQSSFAQQTSAAETLSKYLLPLATAEFALTNTLEQLQQDTFSVKAHNRPLRATGLALDVAISILETALPHTGSRVMLFSGGPCTTGPGLVVGCPHKEAIRSHHDIDEDDAPHYKAACKHYEMLSRRASRNGIVVDIFAGSYDQIGLDEMKPLSDHTGGVMVLTDAFTTSIFKQSFLRVFTKNDDGTLAMAFAANFEVKLSQELRVSGLVGHAVGQNNKTGYVAETAIGIGGTSSWKLCGLSPRSTYALYFDSVGKTPPPITNGAPPQAFVQFITHYQHSSGMFRLRVTTVGRALSQPNQANVLKQSFDQEAAAALLARLAVYRLATQHELIENIMMWLDATLIKMCKHFGEYARDDPGSFRLIPELGYYFPQFIYHLRRSQFLQVFNNSPDETAYYRHVLLTEDTNNSTVMIQPTLMAYSIENPTEGTPVLLDSTSLQPGRILLLDTFFHLLIYYGETIAAWKKAGYQDLDEYANFKTMLQQPRKDASELLVDRFPLPRFIETEAKGSQARFLMARLNPTRSVGNATEFDYGSTMVLTDDVSLQKFMEYLIKYSVSSKQKF